MPKKTKAQKAKGKNPEYFNPDTDMQWYRDGEVRNKKPITQSLSVKSIRQRR